MKTIQLISTALIIILSAGFIACSDDDGNENSFLRIDENGNVSDGSRFVAIDDNNFYINDIKYTVKDGHLVVSGYDIGFSGNANIYSEIEYKSNHYRVLEITDYAFGESKLSSIKIPNSVVRIGKKAFGGCEKLVSITVPEGVTEIANSAFNHCSSLSSVSLPKSLKSIGGYCFGSCTSLKSASIPENVTAIEGSLFHECTSLVEVKLPKGVKIIGNRAFEGCVSLKDVILPDSVNTIDYCAFQGCTSLKDIIIADKINYIGAYAFNGCSSLVKIEIAANDPPTIFVRDEDCSFKNSNHCPIYVPDESLEKYVSNRQWRRFGYRIYSKNAKKRIVENVLPLEVKGVEFNMIIVEGGTFTMGALDDDTEAEDIERPCHQVTLSDFLIGETEVTEKLWNMVMGGYVSSSEEPISKVSWDDCQSFINKLNELTGKRFRLPTEAEWEYAARGGQKSKHYKYAGSDIIDNVAWYSSNSYQSGNRVKHEVAFKDPNELGIYDMSGNVQEWCVDWAFYYDDSSANNPDYSNETGSSWRILRGGDYYNSAFLCRITSRNSEEPTKQYNNVGLRLVLSN